MKIFLALLASLFLRQQKMRILPSRLLEAVAAAALCKSGVVHLGHASSCRRKPAPAFASESGSYYVTFDIFIKALSSFVMYCPHSVLSPSTTVEFSAAEPCLLQ